MEGRNHEQIASVFPDGLINLMRHPVTLRGTGAQVREVTIEPSGQVATVQRTQRQICRVVLDGDNVMPIYRYEEKRIENLPAQTPGRHYIVSQVVAAAAPDRDDLLVPTDVVKDDHGRPVACRSLSRV